MSGNSSLANMIFQEGQLCGVSEICYRLLFSRLSQHLLFLALREFA